MSASIYHQLGRAAQEQRQWQQAEQYYQQALQIYIEFNDRYRQAGTYHNLGIFAQAQQQWQQAKDYLLQALKIFVEYKDNYSVQMTLGKLARLSKESSDTELLTLVAQALNVSVAEIEEFWQDALENTNNEEDSESGEYQRTIADYTEALRLQPDSADAYLGRGNAYAEQGEYQRAMADANEVLRLQPDSANAYLMRGYAYLYLKGIQEARADFQRAAERAPDNVNMHWLVVFASLKKERPGRELADHLERIAAIDENSHYASTCRAVALGLKGNVKDGLKKLEQVLLKDPTSQDDLFWKGVLSAYDTTQPEVAIEAIEKALENGLPPVLLTPLYWLQEEKPRFFEKYAQPILERYGV